MSNKIKFFYIFGFNIIHAYKNKSQYYYTSTKLIKLASFMLYYFIIYTYVVL